MTSIDGGEVRLRVLVENGARGLARSGSQFEDGDRVASGRCHGCFLEVVVARYGLAHHRQVAVQREVVVLQGTASLTKAGEYLCRDADQAWSRADGGTQIEIPARLGERPGMTPDGSMRSAVPCPHRGAAPRQCWGVGRESLGIPIAWRSRS